MSETEVSTNKTDMDSDNLKLEPQFVAESVALDYITQHPDFLMGHPELLEQLRLPHAQKGAISLVEIQLDRQRQKIYQLESEITELMGIANHNEHVFRVYADLYPQIIACKHLIDIKHLLETTFSQAFGISALALRLSDDIFNHQSQGVAISKHQLKQICQHRLGGDNHYFGRLSQHEILQLFGENAQLNSCALLRLGDEQALGILAIGNLDPSHYTPGMDNLLLSQLGGIIAQVLLKLTTLDG